MVSEPQNPRRDDPSGRIVAKMRAPARKQLPEPRVHPGRDWFYVLDATLRLRLGDREVLVSKPDRRPASTP